MVTNVEFLGIEPLDNLITCMNFKIDKVIYFGYQEVIDTQRSSTEMFLKKHCGVKTVEFYSVQKDNLQSTLNTMRREIQYELSQRNQIYFDITGGESLILVAFGMLSKEFETPIHMFDIVADKLIELDEKTTSGISKGVKANKIRLTLDLLIQMHGGRINENLRKNIKNNSDPEFLGDIESIFNIAKCNWDYWNPFSMFLRNVLIPVDATLQVRVPAAVVLSALQQSTTKLRTFRKLIDIIDALACKGLLLDVVHTNGRFSFKYKNEDIKDSLWDGGSILELHTYLNEVDHCDEIQVGLHLDWDGVIHEEPGSDVLNEIDVLSLKGNVATFISCKSGKMDAKQALHALYELETVAGRFGGKYARKVLVTAKEIGEIYRERAEEMGIEVRWTNAV